MAKKDEEPCSLKCLPGKGCLPLIEIREELLTFFADAAKGMEDHSEISELVWKNTRKEVAELVLSTKECFDNMNAAALRLNDGHHKMEGLTKDITDAAEALRALIKAKEEALKVEISEVADDLKSHEEGKNGAHAVLSKKIDDHENGKTGAHAILKNQITWHRRIFYVAAGAFFTLGGWSLMLTIFTLKTHPEFVDVLWAWVK